MKQKYYKLLQEKEHNESVQQQNKNREEEYQ
jgi:hypothetical protein